MNNQSSNEAAKLAAERKLMNHLPFGRPGWNIPTIVTRANINADRARRTLKRLIAQGKVIRERRRVGEEDGIMLDMWRGYQYLYYRPSNQEHT